MTTLAQELPFAAAVADDKLHLVCSNCFNSQVELQRCGRCNVVHYCGVDCQDEDWIIHKKECRFLRKTRPAVLGHLGRLICRIVLKLASDKPTVAFNERKWEDLMDHYENITTDPIRSIEVKELASAVQTFMGDLAPTEEELIRIYGKVKINSFAIVDDNGGTSDVLGEAVYLGLSIHDHSCQPDGFVVFDGRKALLRTADSALGYSTQIKISYVDLTPFTSNRRALLQKNYYFYCNCPTCTDPIRDLWGTSATSLCRPEAVSLQSSDGLRCTECGKEGEFSVEEVQSANREVTEFLRNGGSESLEDHIELFGRMKKILSRVNFALLDLAGRIVGLAVQTADLDTARSHALFAMDAIRKYLPQGTSLTSCLAEIVPLLLPPRNEADVRILEEISDVFRVCYGEDHPQFRRLKDIVHHNWKD